VWYAAQRTRRARVRTEALESDIAAAREEAATAAQEAVVEERRRIAQELHDAVGHAVNVIVVQAGAGRFVTQDDAAREVLSRIEGVGRAALVDLDRMLGLLGAPTGAEAPLAPTHRTADVARLVEGVRATGADVRLEVDGVGDLDHATDAAVFRIVQEALTNSVKHAGPAHIDVTLAGTAQEVVVEVQDDGRGAAAPRPRHGGRGLAGMRERVSVLGGRLEAGPRPGGGFRVRARLPRPDAAS
jgi:signal transduction histidine kinase